jgi:hypothetical protein
VARRFGGIAWCILGGDFGCLYAEWVAKGEVVNKAVLLFGAYEVVGSIWSDGGCIDSVGWVSR